MAIGRYSGVTGMDGLVGGDGGVEGVTGVWKAWEKVTELEDTSVITEMFEFSSKVCSDWIEFCNCLSRWCETNMNCKSSKNNGSGTNLDNSVSEKFTNKDVSNRSSKGISSKYIILTGQDCDLERGLELPELSWLSLSELSWLPCLLRILGIRFGFSNIVGGLGSGFDLVFLLEASVLIYLGKISRNTINYF